MAAWSVERDNGKMTTAPAVPPPVVALAAVVGQRLLSRNSSTPSLPRRVASLTLLGTALSLAGSAAGRFRSAGTTVDPHHPERSTALVTNGVYRLTRNPIYLGLAVALLAHAVHRGSPLALVPVAGYLVWIDRLQIPAEESALAVTFGTEWDAYCASVPRWLSLPQIIRETH